MQACEVCGRQAREGARVCASCQAEGETPAAADAGVLAGVLGTTREADDVRRQPPETDVRRATLSRRPRGPRRDDDGREQVVLREVEPGGDDQQWPRRTAATSVAASLIEAFQSPTETGTATTGTGTATAEPLAPPDEPTSDEPTSDEPTSDEPTSHRTEAAHAPTGATTTTTAEPSAQPDDDAAVDATDDDAIDAAGMQEAETADRSPPSDDAGPVTDRFAHIPTVPMEPTTAAELPADTTPAPLDAVGATAVPPAPVRAVIDVPTKGPDAIGSGATASSAAPTPTVDHPGVQPGTAHERDMAGPAWRVALREAGTWTTVAQFTLLFIGMLCVFQVVVLLVVSQFLSRAQGPGVVAADMLAAHGKVATVMLPALVGGAFTTAAFAAWRAHADPREWDDTSRLRRRLLGVPVAVWAVVAAATALLVVVLFGTSATVVEAQRMTWWAIGACTLLGVTCVVAPRGLATREPDDEDGAPAPVGDGP